MLPLGTVLGTASAYVLIAVLLLSLNLRSRWRWWIKAGSIVVTTLFFAATYTFLTSMLGWPTSSDLTQRFSLLETRLVDPDALTGETGQIFLWVDELDANNIPMPRPRALEIAYSDRMARLVRIAQERLDAGEQVMGEFTQNTGMSPAPAPVPVQEEGDQELMAANQRREGGSMIGAATIGAAPDELAFSGMPAPVLPEKGPE